MKYALELSNVCKNYPDFSLKNVSFSVPGGTIMGFIGENGAGKTTTIKAILNLLRLNRDNIMEEREAKQDVGVVVDSTFFPAEFHLKEVQTILRNIYVNWDDREYQACVQKFQLPETKKIREYSKGMLMKLSIASALAHHPKLLILDVNCSKC